MKNLSNEECRMKNGLRPCVFLSDHKTTRSVRKTVPSEARVTRDEVSGFINAKQSAVWKTVPKYPFNPFNPWSIKTSEVVYFFFEHGSNGLNG